MVVITKHNMFLLVLMFWMGLNYRSSLATEPKTRVRAFPANFKFGAATAAYQIEGAWDADGKGPSIWDTFAHQHPDKILDRSNGDIATDSYHLYKEDVAVLKRLGANFYRFSFSWSRILPTGEISSRNQLGVDYYHRLIDELTKNGIEPIATIYHWDLPQYLQDLGGWANPLIVDYFESFANLLFKEYGTKIKKWITFNEPLTYCKCYAPDAGPPRIATSGVGDYLCAHHTIISHARVYRLYRNKYYPTLKGVIGITLNISYPFPKDPNNKEDIEAANRALQFKLGLYTHPIFSKEGDYPQIVREIIDKNSANEGREWSRLPKFNQKMIEYIKGTADFVGINYYTAYIVQPSNHDDHPNPSLKRDSGYSFHFKPEWSKSASSWLCSVPEGLYQLLLWIRNSYDNIEILITEIGWSDSGELEDVGRIKYLNDHFDAILNAIESGVNITGATIWSLVDNFEWLQGYTEKFGIVRVDRDDVNLTRVLKKSAGYLETVFKSRQITVNV